MEIDGSKQLGPHRHETHQRIHAAVVDRQPLRTEEAVVQQTIQIKRLLAVPGHVGVAEHEVHVVDRVDAAQQTPQQYQPARLFLLIALARPRDQPGDLLPGPAARRRPADGWDSRAAAAAAAPTRRE